MIHIKDAPSSPIYEDRPLHKKNPKVGSKKLALYENVWIDMEDAVTFEANEEVMSCWLTLADLRRSL